ncbi:MAG TPA: RHS repeat-associated core domain-containing protein, partial [Candidatus Angelobacter sp.]|nr:RHS repeat-associated core domain-containing protein [Candidatus Angelobacter sp.]
DSNHYKYGGHERDNETNLDYYGARYYGNALGRFMSPDWSAIPVPVPYADPSNPQSLNQYAYVRNNPMSYGDPDGHDCPPCDTDVQVDMEMVKQTLQQLGPVAVPAVAVAGPAAVLAAPSVGGMAVVVAAPRFEVEDCAGPYCDMFVPAPAKNPEPTPTPNTQPKPQTPPAPQLGYKKDEDDKEHTKGKRKSTKDKHEKVDPGKKQPPSYKPDRKYVQPKDDKKKDKPKPPYHRKDRDKKQEGS